MVTAASVADHIEPHKHDVNRFFLGRLQSLCASCHSRLKQQVEASGFDRAIGADGLPLSKAHPIYRYGQGS
jgi:5-methylcytosine-specific restriction protein A